MIDTFGELVKTGAVPEELWKNQTLPKLKGLQGGVGTVCFPFLFLGGCGVLLRARFGKNLELIEKIDSLLRRPRAHPAVFGEVRHLQGSLPALGRAL